MKIHHLCSSIDKQNVLMKLIKVHYRKLLLRFVLVKIDKTNDTASLIVRSKCTQSHKVDS